MQVKGLIKPACMKKTFSYKQHFLSWCGIRLAHECLAKGKQLLDIQKEKECIGFLNVHSYSTPYFRENSNRKKCPVDIKACYDSALIQSFEMSPHLIVWSFHPQTLQWPALQVAPHGGLWSHEPWSGKFKCLLWLSWSMKATVNIWIFRFLVHETKAHRVVPP